MVVYLVYVLGMTSTSEDQGRVVFDTLRRSINQSVSVKAWNKVVVERELYFNFSDFFEIPSFKFHDGKLTVTISDAGVWIINPISIPNRMTILFNGNVLYHGDGFTGSRTFDIKGVWVGRENYVRVEYDGGFGNYVWMTVSNVTIEIKVSYYERDRESVIEANEESTKRNREYLSSLINNPPPNTTITPSGDPVTSFLQTLQQLPQIILAIVMIMILVEIIRAFRR
jgi:hypothetical protein